MSRVAGGVLLVVLWCGSAFAQGPTVPVWRLVIGTDARTIADNGGGTPATLTLNPLTSHVSITCNDADGCAITLSETGFPGPAVNGLGRSMPVTIVNLSANAVTLADTAGVQELQSSISLAQYASTSCTYEATTWVCGASGGGAGTVTTTGAPASGNLAAFSGASSITNTNLTGDVTTTNTVATTIANDAVSNAKLRNSGALSVIGRSANSSGDPADISAVAASDAVLRESGSTIGFGTIATAGIANAAVTYAKIQDVSAASRFLCRGSAAGSGDVEECTFGSGLSLSGTQLTSTGGGGGSTSVYPTRAEGRLTTESAVPISTTDRTSQSTLYWSPCVTTTAPNCIAVTTGVITLWNGTSAVDFATTQLSLALTALTSGANYDVFIDYNSGAPQIVLSAAWSTDTARADALASQYDSTRQVTLIIKSGTPAYRWVGTIRTTGTTTTEDSGGITGTTQVGGKRFVWNAYNQVPRDLKVIDTTDTWSYTTDTIRQADGAAGNKVEYVTGDATSTVEVFVVATVKLASNTIAAKSGVGIDSTTTFAGLVAEGAETSTGVSFAQLHGSYQGQPGLGYHYVSWNEKGADGTSLFVGDNGADSSQSGLRARIWN